MPLTTGVGVGQQPAAKPSVVVVGAGAFGGWTALHLQTMGARVTLCDAWGSGNSRASSGGETRIIRATYGSSAAYYPLVARSLELFRNYEKHWRRKLFFPNGVLWLASKDGQRERDSLPRMRDIGWHFETLTAAEASRRFPQFNFTDVEWAIYETSAGYLLARQWCAAVLEAFIQAGGQYRQVHVQPGPYEGQVLRSVSLSDGTSVAADQYVFACGPWLGKTFPDVIGDAIKPSRQEVYFFGTPAGDKQYLDEQFPTWIDNGERDYYGIPGNERRGFKLAWDAAGAPADPTSQERTITPELLNHARDYLGFRFPGLRGAPLVEARVCQYENSPDSHFIVDRHPLAENVWLVGGGSGHGFKMGPGLGEQVAQLVLGQRKVDPLFSLARLARN